MKKMVLSLMAAMIILTSCGQGEAKNTSEPKPQLESIMLVMVKQGQELKRLEQEKLEKEKQEQARVQAEKLAKVKAEKEKKAKEVSVSSVNNVNVPLDDDLVGFIFEQSEANDIDPYLLLGLIKTESDFDASLSHYNDNGTTDHGLTQINDVVLDDMIKAVREDDLIKGEVDPYNAYHSVLLSIEELKMCREYFEDTYSGTSLEKAMIGAYNRGRYGMKKYINNNGHMETSYVKKVYKNKNMIMEDK